VLHWPSAEHPLFPLLPAELARLSSPFIARLARSKSFHHHIVSFVFYCPYRVPILSLPYLHRLAMSLPITMAASPWVRSGKVWPTTQWPLPTPNFPEAILLTTFGKSREGAGLQYISADNKIADGQWMHLITLKRLWV
jgi:hypothetical protein